MLTWPLPFCFVYRISKESCGIQYCKAPELGPCSFLVFSKCWWWWWKLSSSFPFFENHIVMISSWQFIFWVSHWDVWFNLVVKTVLTIYYVLSMLPHCPLRWVFLLHLFYKWSTEEQRGDLQGYTAGKQCSCTLSSASLAPEPGLPGKWLLEITPLVSYHQKEVPKLWKVDKVGIVNPFYSWEYWVAEFPWLAQLDRTRQYLSQD